MKPSSSYVKMCEESENNTQNTPSPDLVGKKVENDQKSEVF